MELEGVGVVSRSRCKRGPARQIKRSKTKQIQWINQPVEICSATLTLACISRGHGRRVLPFAAQALPLPRGRPARRIPQAPQAPSPPPPPSNPPPPFPGTRGGEPDGGRRRRRGGDSRRRRRFYECRCRFSSFPCSGISFLCCPF